ncbi:MAG: response regulator transcription factor [Pyrinomonadaceae bacterium]
MINTLILEQMAVTVNGNNIRTAIIEAQADIRDGLASLIGFTPGFKCTGSYQSMEEALEGIRFDIPDVVLSDIGLPGMGGIQGIKLLKAQYPELLILMLTVYDDDERIFDALCAGANGFLLKRTAPMRLLESLKDALAGSSPMSPEVATKVIRLFREFRPPDQADYDLTPHEMRLLKLLVEGHNYKTASRELNHSINTVKFYIKRIYEKLQVHSKSEAVAKALKERLLE